MIPKHWWGWPILLMALVILVPVHLANKAVRWIAQLGRDD